MLTEGRFNFSTSERTAVLLIVILGLGLFLRTFNLHNEDAWNDEIVTLEHLDTASLHDFLNLVKARNPIHPPLYMVLQHGWAQLFGFSEYATRLLSVTAGMLCLVMMYVLTRLLYGSQAGLISTLWLSFIPIHIYHAQEIRFYAFVTLFGLLSMYSFTKLVQDGRRRWWVLLTFADLAVLWTQPLGAAIFVAQATYLVVFFRHRIRFILSWMLQHVFVCLTLLPWALSIDSSLGSRSLRWLSIPNLLGPRPSLESFLRVTAGELSLPTNRLGELLFPFKPVLTGLLILSYVVAAIFVIRASMKPNTHGGEATAPNGTVSQRQALGLVLLWFLIPPLILFVISHLWRPVFVPRYLISSMLAPYILLAACVTRLSSRARPYVLVTLLIFNLGYQATFHFPGPHRVRYGKAAELIVSMGPSQGPVAVHGPGPGYAMQFHLRNEGIRVKHLQTQKAFMGEALGKNPGTQARWFILKRKPYEVELVRQLEIAGTPYRKFDLTASRYLVVIYLGPKESS